MNADVISQVIFDFFVIPAKPVLSKVEGAGIHRCLAVATTATQPACPIV